MKKSDRSLLKNALGFISPKDHLAESLIAQILDRLAEPEDKPFAWYSPKLKETYLANCYTPHDGDLPLYQRPSH